MRSLEGFADFSKADAVLKVSPVHKGFSPAACYFYLVLPDVAKVRVEYVVTQSAI